MDTSNPYLILKPLVSVLNISKKYLPDLEKVKTYSEWKDLGYNVLIDQYGIPSRNQKNNYYFQTVNKSDKVILDAIALKKKAIISPQIISDYFLAGVGFDDFLAQPNAVVEYCLGVKAYCSGKLNDALAHFGRSFEVDKNELLYSTNYYKVRVELGDVSAISEEFEWFKSDIDSMIHSGRVDAWFTCAIKNQDIQLGRALITNVNDAIDDLISGKSKNRYWGRQNVDWYIYKKEQFAKATIKYLEKFNKIEDGTYKEPIAKKLKMKSVSTKPISAEKASKCLYEFCQLVSAPSDQNNIESIENKLSVFDVLNTNSFSVNDFNKLASENRTEVKDLFMQYIIFFELNRNLEFDPKFLDCSTKRSIGKNLLLYMRKNKWPFPQMR